MNWLTRPIEVPHRLRAIVRARESSVIVLAVVIGAIAGLASVAARLIGAPGAGAQTGGVPGGTTTDPTATPSSSASWTVF